MSHLTHLHGHLTHHLHDHPQTNVTPLTVNCFIYYVVGKDFLKISKQWLATKENSDRKSNDITQSFH